MTAPTEKNEKPKGWFKQALEKYDNFLKTYDLDSPSCCGVPKMREDENGNLCKEDSLFKK
ncbi:hypothetical protein BKK51_07705 [Rodentibacter trehalosifermentans]|uniref:Uncharacterized protein n=1 Tax=Rodentibacter trehalosifermentans TaxID=1908263 RepID=A0A1V3ISP5_9PAST|nr:DUF5363 family protein [Rodentibacter trehalosifermentans]OOF44964.1 hypothetical protein BKK51_07705 [Rodentibacter trehalosifermentans]OOF47981.1 hypothetical protein BKK52_07120 [Rodentibacter trehalosifermentans]